MSGFHLTGEQQKRQLKHLEAKEALFSYLAEKNAENIDDFLMFYKWQALLETCNEEQYRTYHEAFTIHKRMIEERRQLIQEAKANDTTWKEEMEEQRREKMRIHEERQQFVDKRNKERAGFKAQIEQSNDDDVYPSLYPPPAPPPEEADLEFGMRGTLDSTASKPFRGATTIDSNTGKKITKVEKKRRKMKFVPGSEKDRELLFNKIQLVILMIVALLTPAVVLYIQGQNEKSKCGDESEKCKARCIEIFRRENPIYASELLPEKNCLSECGNEATNCEDGTRAVLGAALFLAAGLGVTLCMIYLLQTMMADNEGNIAAIASKKPRPAYAEPNQTEEERVKAIEKKKKEPVAWNAVEARCLDCKINVVVDAHWMPDPGLECLKGGMKSAICTRCRRPVVGIL